MIGGMKNNMPHVSGGAAADDRSSRFFHGCFSAVLVVAIICAVAAICGCASDPVSGDVTLRIPAAAVNAAKDAAAALAEGRRGGNFATEEPDSDAEPVPDAAEEEPDSATEKPDSAAGSVPDSAAETLVFRFGGFDGSKAVVDPSVRISSLALSADGMSYRYEAGDLSAWGLSRTDAGALACAFSFDPASGAWVGGKFDWISSSRTTRDWKNIRAGYNGWNADAFFSAPRVAFCIVSRDGRRRTNLIEGAWK